MDNLHPKRVAELRASDPEKAKRLGDRYHASIEKLSAAIGMSKDSIYELIDDAASTEKPEVRPQ